MKDLVLIEVTMVVAIETQEGEDTAWVCAMDYVTLANGAVVVGFSEERLEIIAVSAEKPK